MQRWKVYGLIAALVCGFIFAPVAACHADLLKTVDDEECTNAEITYEITATPSSATGWYVKVVDSLPPGTTYFSSTAPAGFPSATGVFGTGGIYDLGAGHVTWIYGPVPSTPTKMTVTVKYANPGTYKNTVRSWVSHYNNPYNWGGKVTKIDAVTKTVIPCGEELPEFPTIALPVGMIIGFLGVVFFVRGTKE